MDTKKKPKRGVSAYSYQGEYGLTIDLEDIFEEMQDMGARGLEILGNSHIDDYPYVSDEWLENWQRLLKQYNIIPVEYGHWVDSRLYEERELTVEESLEALERDFIIAHKLGFKILRTKLGVIDEALTPVENWKEFIRQALPMAEKYDVCMCPEIHTPTWLNSDTVKEYIRFIDETGTKHFGLNIDFSIFQNKSSDLVGFGEHEFHLDFDEHSEVEELIPILPYVKCCHAKFLKVNEDFQEVVIPYDRILQVLMDYEWDGYLLSEYEGPGSSVVGVTSDQIRRHHMMMKRLLKED